MAECETAYSFQIKLFFFLEKIFKIFLIGYNQNRSNYMTGVVQLDLKCFLFIVTARCWKNKVSSEFKTRGLFSYSSTEG